MILPVRRTEAISFAVVECTLDGHNIGVLEATKDRHFLLQMLLRCFCIDKSTVPMFLEDTKGSIVDGLDRYPSPLRNMERLQNLAVGPFPQGALDVIAPAEEVTMPVTSAIHMPKTEEESWKRSRSDEGVGDVKRTEVLRSSSFGLDAPF